MPVYIITGDTVAACKTPPADLPEGAYLVRSADELANSDLGGARLVAIWNTLPGATKIANFKDRNTGARRLWAAFEKLPVAAGQQADPPATKTKAPARKRIMPLKPASRSDSKQAKVIALLKRPGGATLDALMKATGWQRHTIRGAIAGALKKRLKLKVTSTKSADGARVYRITGAA